MADNRISPSIWTASSAPEVVSPGRAPVTARLTARLRAGRLDAMLAVGAAPTPRTALAVHAARVTSREERECLARTLLLARRDAQDPTVTLTARIPLHRENVACAADLIDAIALRLHSPLPVSARGMARLRRVMADGRGPLYRHGRGDLAGRLGAAFAAL